MFPYYFGGGLSNNSSLTPLLPFALTNYDYFNQGLPDEVKAAIEERKDEIHNEDDLHRIAHEVMQKR